LTSGLLDQEHCWLYYPEGALRLRLIGQLILTKLIEKCINNNYRVISANTDGAEIIIPKKEWDHYKEMVKEVEQQFNLEFEHEKYSFIYYKNVNGYICKTESGKIKRKGLFKIPKNEAGQDEIPLGDSINEPVIAIALNNYFVNNIPIEETICNPEKYNLHIYDYTCSNKISKEYEVWYNNEQIQNLNRYYFSKPAPFLLKRKKENAAKRKLNANFEHVNAGNPVIIFNNYEHKEWQDYKINFNHYLAKCRQIINELNSKRRQLTLF